MYTYRKTKMVSIQCFSNFQSAIEVFMVLTVRENATELVTVVIKSREFVKMVASQDGKATFVKAVTFILFKLTFNSL